MVTRDYGGRLGHAVCSIDGEGNRVDACPGVDGHWHYWRLMDGRWVESDTGPSTTRPDVLVAEGWTWVAGANVEPPRAASGAAICALGFASAGDDASTSGNDGAGPAITGFAGVAVVVGALGTVAARRRRRV